jgi:hypothetical protein
VNILVTTACNRRECDFCFEQSVPALRAGAAVEPAGARHLPRAALAPLLAHARRWRVPRVALLGGEPTQHPEIVALDEEALGVGVEVLLVTNAVIAPRAAAGLAALASGAAGARLRFLVNPHLRPDQPRGERGSIERNLAWMGARATLSVTLTQAAFDLTAYGDLIERYALNPWLRVSLGHAMLGGENEHAAPSELPVVGAALAREARALLARGVRCVADCGFPICMFAAGGPGAGAATIRTGAARAREAGLDLRSVCRPLLDVHPDGGVSHCLPLAPVTKVRLPPGAEVSRAEIVERLVRAAGRPPFLYESCAGCALRAAGECVAGCLATRRRAAEAPERRSPTPRRALPIYSGPG